MDRGLKVTQLCQAQVHHPWELIQYWSCHQCRRTVGAMGQMVQQSMTWKKACPIFSSPSVSDLCCPLKSCKANSIWSRFSMKSWLFCKIHKTSQRRMSRMSCARIALVRSSMPLTMPLIRTWTLSRYLTWRLSSWSREFLMDLTQLFSRMVPLVLARRTPCLEIKRALA